MNTFVMQMVGPDAPGLIYKVTEMLYRKNCNVIRQDEYVSPDNQFFMRTAFSNEGQIDQEDFTQELRKSIKDPSITISFKEQKKKNLVLFCTKEHHCLSEIITKQYFGELEANILAVVSNHEVLRPFVEKFDIPFHYLSAENLSREAHEETVFKCLDAYDFDYMVLAKYMRILTPDFVVRYVDKIVNIHHSFLPAFIGANPYKQAFERGVKIIGATAHFVNNMLDEGPIIAQDIKEVDHRYSAADMAKEGRDVEKTALMHALKLVLADRVFIHKNKTVIL